MRFYFIFIIYIFNIVSKFLNNWQFSNYINQFIIIDFIEMDLILI